VIEVSNRGRVVGNSSSARYEANYDEDEESDGEISLQADSNVDRGMWDTVCSREDGVLSRGMPEGIVEECKFGVGHLGGWDSNGVVWGAALQC